VASCARRELAILASQRACMRVVVRRLAAVLLEFPAHPASVPDADSISNVSLSKQKAHHKGELFVLLVGRRHPYSRATIGFRSMIQTRYPQYYPHSTDVIQKSESHQNPRLDGLRV